jgi:AcrR family transcriptional regulator
MNNTRQAESRKIAAARPSRQRARTEATRRKLLAAAEKTFARDGFEAARLEDIASLAGYTRGAFYANFKSKEDIFFALLEEWVGRRIAEVSAVLARENTPEKRLRALREHYAQIAHAPAASSRLWRRPRPPHRTRNRPRFAHIEHRRRHWTRRALECALARTPGRQCNRHRPGYSLSPRRFLRRHPRNANGTVISLMKMDVWSFLVRI